MPAHFVAKKMADGKFVYKETNEALVDPFVPTQTYDFPTGTLCTIAMAAVLDAV